MRVDGLHTAFRSRDGRGELTAVDGVSFDLHAGETLGLVGESGCGKSATALSILGLLPSAGRVSQGSVWFEGNDLFQLDNDAMRRLRGNRIAMIFQDPMSALNPLMRIGDQVGEVLRIHRGASRAEAYAAAIDLLRSVRIPEPERRAAAFPHELSGGMRQRAMIAMAIACRPAVLIADEPTTALDVTVQAQILDLIADLQAETGMAVLLVTHDLGVVAERARRVAVMYGGRIVETGNVADVLGQPAHPYTRALIRSLPENAIGGRLQPIAGNVPSLGHFPSGCRFRDRCIEAQDLCSRIDPSLEPVRPGQWAACVMRREN